MSKKNKTILMIHGMWLGGWFWNNYVQYFEARGYRCLTPTLRYHDMTPHETPNPLLGTTSLHDYVDDLEQAAAGLDDQLLVMGHSMGGLLAQMLAARIRPKALVLLAPGWPYGTMVMSPSVIRAFWSAITRWGFWKKPHRFTFQEAAYAVFNRMPVQEQQDLYGKCIFESGRVIAEIGLWPLDLKKTASVDESRITCPVLTVVGTEDRIIPPFAVRKVAAKYRAVHKEYPGRGHWLLGEPGWETIAAEIAGWLDLVDHG